MDVDRLLLAADRDEALRRLRRALRLCQDAKQRVHLCHLCEELSSSDWAKIGVILGILWYKLDKMISALERK